MRNEAARDSDERIERPKRLRSSDRSPVLIGVLISKLLSELTPPPSSVESAEHQHSDLPP